MHKQNNNKRRNGGYKSRTGSNNNRSRGGRRRGPNRSFDPRLMIRQTPKDAPAVEPFVPENSFADFLLSERLYKNIVSRGFTAPTPIQDEAIPQITAGKDVVGVANTGTGKTAAFLIPLINKVNLVEGNRVLIVAPTRELSLQIEKELQNFSSGLGINSANCIGGVNINSQIKRLKRKPQFVIGTPGRLLDLENRREINFAHFNAIVLDEVDRMLDMGFIHDVDKIIGKLPKERQSLFFSATLDGKVKSVMGKFISNPVMITVKKSDIQAHIHQDIIELNGRNKTDVLRDLLNSDEVQKTLIFMRTKHGADKLHKNLSREGFNTTVMHGDKRQSQRKRALDNFRRGHINIMIATDVASRGIDVDDITHVINHDLPETYDDYIHRIGRTGRTGKQGTAVTFVG